MIGDFLSPGAKFNLVLFYTFLFIFLEWSELILTDDWQ